MLSHRSWPGLAHGRPVRRCTADFCFVCSGIVPRNILLAGLDPAIHVLQLPRSCKRKTWVAGSSPAKGYLELSPSPNLQPNLLNRTAVGLTRASTSFRDKIVRGKKTWVAGSS